MINLMQWPSRVNRGDGGLLQEFKLSVLFDLNHPAHYHMFKYAMAHLKSAGVGVHVIARQKDCLVELLRSGGWEFYLIPRHGKSVPAMAWESLRGVAIAVWLAIRHKAKLMVGTSVTIGLASRLSGGRSVVFNEDDQHIVPLFTKLAYPLAHYIVTPEALASEDHGKGHLTYRGYQKLAYLHPAWFRPDANVRAELGLAQGERYFLVRLVSLTAHHDVGQRGLDRDQVGQIIERLQPHGRVFISAECEVDDSLKPLLLPTPPERILDVLAFADMFIGDSQSMTTEAALLGTPSLRCNTFVGRITVLEELEHRHRLVVGVRPDEFPRVLAQMDEWLCHEDLKGDWQRRRDAMLAQCQDVSKFMIELFERLHTRSPGRRSQK